ncbi:EAL domain-containing protein [Paenibacillus qinlingensis]|uniref:Diguanylate cyclase (GGDEF)-like protein n=1 Tax=Paenibacillus qinlingensis TaxID=1837343 RepID=A0ABU1NWZ7_9BACL|nr:EAL domain-containing protein [Paenibacillus qinlingensis]MDR6551601.1 diguanylate cyclase (GGDEF)-like protein [Paenibacillus qinlingensis]
MIPIVSKLAKLWRRYFDLFRKDPNVQAVGLKLFVWAVGGTVILFVGFSYFSYSHSQQIVIDKVTSAAKQTVVQSRDTLNIIFRNYEDITFSILTDEEMLHQLHVYGSATTNQNEKFVARNKIVESLAIRFFSKSDITNIHLIPVDPKLKEITTDTLHTEIVDYSKEEWFQRAVIANGEIGWLATKRYGYSNVGQPSFAINRLIKLSSGMKYVLLIEISSEVLKRSFGDIQNGEMVILNPANQLMTRTFSELEGDFYRIPNVFHTNPIHAGHPSDSITIKVDGDMQLVVAEKIAASDWIVQAVIPTSELFKDANTIGKSMLISMIGIAVITYLINYYLQRRRNAIKIRYMAYHDHLTDLANRKLFMEVIEKEIQLARHNRQEFTVLFLDLDRFKIINDTFGHEAGDRMLIETARRLEDVLDQSCTVARFGGDEFLILLPNRSDHDAILSIIHQITTQIQRPVYYEEKELHVSVSIGVSRYPQDGNDIQCLTKYADTAMYSAKESGRNNYKFYNTNMEKNTYEKLSLERDLRHAIERDELLLYYQPQIELSSGTIVGVETLTRWNHPKLGFIPPSEFIPIAEYSRLIVPIGKWILYTACKQNKAWQDAGLPKVHVAVNLSIHQFQNSEIIQTVAHILQETGLEPQYLELEITESIAMQDVEKVILTLQGLYALGVKISIDDFGTGYSSLNYLKNFPIQRLKIDKSFLDDIVINPKERAIVGAIIIMAHSLNLRVTAEGVETMEQVALLQACNCDEIQGYIYSRPIPTHECAELLAERRVYETTERLLQNG